MTPQINFSKQLKTNVTSQEVNLLNTQSSNRKEARFLNSDQKNYIKIFEVWNKIQGYYRIHNTNIKHSILVVPVS